jgi:hypothetical protein
MDEFSNGHEIFNTQRIQNGSYWMGAALGAMVMLLVVLIVDRLNDKAEQIPTSLMMPKDVVEAYRMGLKDAMRTNPPSLELEQTCMNMWADRQPVKE